MSELRTLLDRNVYYACDLQNEAFANFHGELSRIRKSFFEGMRKSQSVHKRLNESGFSGKLKGAISNRRFKWKKSLNKINVEEAFLKAGSFVVVRRDMNGRICAKLYFDRNLRWIKTEYYSPDNYMSPKSSIYPHEKEDVITLETRQEKISLYPSEYKSGSAAGMQGSSKSNPMVLVSAADGEYVYSKMKEPAAVGAADDGSTLMFVNTWQVKDGEVPEAAVEAEPEFTSIDDHAKLVEAAEAVPAIGTDIALAAAAADILDAAQPDNEEEAAAENTADESAEENSDGESADVQPEEIPSEVNPEEERTSEETAEPAEESQEEAGQSDESVTEENPSEAHEETEQPDTAEDELSIASFETVADELIADGKYNYTGKLKAGKRQGRGRTETLDGVTVYDGEYQNDKKDGFGASFYKDGKLSYVGSWKEDIKNGMGISFRAADHALHIAQWVDGKASDNVTLIDSEGCLKYSGMISGGKKNGAGICVRKEDGCIYVGNFADGEISGQGSLFDSEGLLLYNGHWENGLRNGTGTEFDKSGSIVYSGEWKDDKYLNGILYQKIK